MRVLIKNGIAVNADGQAKQDLLIESGIVRQLGTDISPQLPCEEIDASGCYVFLAAWMSIRISILMSASRAVVMIFLPVPAQLRVAVQQPLLTIWDLAQMAAVTPSTGSLSRLCRPQSSHRLQLSRCHSTY